MKEGPVTAIMLDNEQAYDEWPSRNGKGQTKCPVGSVPKMRGCDYYRKESQGKDNLSDASASVGTCVGREATVPLGGVGLHGRFREDLARLIHRAGVARGWPPDLRALPRERIRLRRCG